MDEVTAFWFRIFAAMMIVAIHHRLGEILAQLQIMGAN